MAPKERNLPRRGLDGRSQGRLALVAAARPWGPESDEADAFAPILSSLRCRFDVDLRLSTTPPLIRRIRRRMALVGAAQPLDYADRLAVDREEAALLLAECLAGEFGLLRERGALAAVLEKAIARLGGAREIRVWVAGCGGGEDAYALAIGFCEAAARGAALDYKILATDADDAALAVAVAGRFSLDALDALTPDLVERHFERDGDGLRANPELRRRILFNRHDLWRDPPFARVDLVSCRYALAAQPREARAQALRLFHSALTPGGLLLLDPSQSLGEGDGFEVLDRERRIFGRPLRAARDAPRRAAPSDDAADPTRDLEALLHAAEIGAVFLDDGLRVRRFTAAAARAFVLTSHDIGRGIAEVGLRFHGVNFMFLLAEAETAGVMREVEISVEGHAYLLRISPHGGADAAHKGAVVTVIDVEALKTARRRVRDLNRRNQTVIESLSETIVSWDPRTEHILFSNGAFAQTLDLNVEDLLGRPLAAVLHPEVYRHKREAMAALASQPFVTSLVRAPKPSGEIVWRSMRYTRVNGFDGRLVAYLACGRDVSDQMRYVEALEALAGLATPIDQPFETFAAQALQIGAGLLGVPCAALAQSEGERRRVACFVGPENASGLCEIALAQALETARRPADAVSQIPAASGLVACAGATVRVGAEFFGAVCFFSAQAPAYGPITDMQRGFVRHVAQWIGMKIEIHRQHLSLRRSEAELRLIFDNVAQNIWRLDRSHRVRWANAGAAQAMGLDARSVVGAPADAFMQRLDPKWRAHGEAAFGSQTPHYGVEAEFRQKGEAPQWTSTDFAPDNEGPEGEPSLLVVSSDITLLKEREAELEVATADADHSRRLYQRHYRRTPVLLCSFQSDGRIVETSDLWRDKTGYSREELVGRRLGDFMDEPSRRCAAEEALPALWRTGACEAFPLRFVAKSGLTMDVELSGFLSAEDGAPLCLAVLVDVTARNAAETALERANRDLAAVNDGLKKFAHVASHDLQEPLRKIRQVGDLLMSEHRQSLSGDAAFYVDVMCDSSDRMRRLIKDILDFSRTINTTVSRTRLSLVDIARDIMSELDMAVREAGAEVRLGSLPCLWGDRTAVQLLFRNLVGNSLKYRRPGVTPEVSISGAWTSDAEFTLSFKDNGSGVDPRYHDIIFDAFTRRQTRGEADGSGLGLAICKSVCERQQWRIAVKSAPGEGAEFTVAIPAADVIADPLAARRP